MPQRAARLLLFNFEEERAMDIIIILIIGIAAGAVAQRWIPERPAGVGVSLGLGIIGSFAGAFVAHIIGFVGFVGFLAAAIGAAAFVAGYRWLGQRRTRV